MKNEVKRVKGKCGGKEGRRKVVLKCPVVERSWKVRSEKVETSWGGWRDKVRLEGWNEYTEEGGFHLLIGKILVTGRDKWMDGGKKIKESRERKSKR